jgi:soluble lytic murein transglycosylase
MQARALFALGREDAAQKELDRALKGGPDIGAEAAMLRAKRILKRGDRSAAREAMAEVVQRFPSRAPADEAHFYMGWLDLQRRLYAEAVRTFTEFARKRPGSRRVDEALWFKSLAQLRLQEYAAAKATLDELLKRFPRSSLAPQARYWSARAAQLGGAPAEAVAPEYEELIAAFPGSFYALTAQARLLEAGRSPPPPFPEPPSTIEEKTPPELERAVALSRSGLFRDAALEVDAQLAAVRNPGDALRFGQALQQLGEFGQAHALAARHLWANAFGEKQPAAVALFYPRAFRAAVERESRANKVPAAFVWAIMRRESAFRPDAASPADARGLMQIIPPTARAIAKALGDVAPAPDALFAPETNIRYGAWYLARLWERFQHPALAAAAYNAGAPAVAEWLNGDRQVPLDLFVELIPYRETRGYVKQVLADFHLYEFLYRDGQAPAARLAMTLPEPKDGGVNF